MKTPDHPIRSILPRRICGFAAALGLLVSALTPATASALIVPETIVLYATNVVPNAAWTDESYAQGNPGNLDCNGVPAQYAYINTGGTYLRATAFEPAPSMSGYIITRVQVEALCRYDSGTNARINARINVGNGFVDSVPTPDSWTSDPNLCSWRLTTAGDITLSADWNNHPERLNQIQIEVAKQSGVTATLRVKAFKIVITRQQMDCDGDGIGDLQDTLTSPVVTGVFATPATGLMGPGGAVSVRVNAQSNAAMAYQWLKNGVPIGEGGPFHNTNTATLRIDPVSLADAGQYSCSVANSCGQRTSAAIVIRVCRSDFDLSGAVDVNDIFTFIGRWFEERPECDFNHDGVIDVHDIFDFLTQWFTGC